MAEPSGGSALPTSGAWASATAATAGTAALLALLGLGGSPGRRAALLGASASMLWALVATFIKATTDTMTQFGVTGMFPHWPLYALAVTGLAAEFLNQAALHVGPLSVSQPFIVIVDPIVSIALSVWIFGETFTADVARLAVGSFAFAAMCVAVTVLRSECPGHDGSGPCPCHRGVVATAQLSPHATWARWSSRSGWCCWPAPHPDFDVAASRGGRALLTLRARLASGAPERSFSWRYRS